jgi:uncharacterized protein
VGATNRLAGETSPYLRQHAGNPVDWYPWGDDAFTAARERDVPVFLSIGYSACHWCHVMAHESFEDDDVAGLLNARFVPVKVDREERPDVDAVYMAAVLAQNGHGGWPMSVFLTPDGRPFFAGTYFPRRDRAGLPGFPRLLEAVSEAWAERRPEVERQADALTEAADRQAGAGLGEVPESSPVLLLPDPALRQRPPWRAWLEAAVSELSDRFDESWGGFGPAPKFPQPGLIELCLRHHRSTGEPRSLEMAEHTLRSMAAGGIHDQLGGGFCRYSTDETWTVPHFEKMLYDQAGLLRAYLHAWLVTANPQWLQVVEDIVEYVRRDLRQGEGGLFSAEDADSEGEEGRFYLWSRPELDAVLGDEAPAAAHHFAMDGGPNFEGRSILRLALDTPLVRSGEVDRWRRALFEGRARRVRPGLDDKVLTEWNAMFCSALAEAASASGRRDWARTAESVAQFLLDNLRDDKGRWLRSWQGGRARHLGYAADYAWLVDCFTRLAELTGHQHWLGHARDAADGLLALFHPDEGPLRTTGEDAPALIVRPVESLDDATPSATAVAGGALLRLGALCAEDHLSEAGTGLLHSLDPLVERHPLAGAWAVAATELVSEGIVEVVVAGDRPDLVQAVRARFEPTVVLAWGEPGRSALWEGRVDGLAYVCRERVCAAPADSVQQLEDRLEEAANRPAAANRPTPLRGGPAATGPTKAGHP